MEGKLLDSIAYKIISIKLRMNKAIIIIDYFRKGDIRSLKVKRNILQMILIKGGIILIGLLLVPLTINYVDSERYGIWMTLNSMVVWISFFDIGLSNGLKNKLTESLAHKDYELCKKYISTTYAILTLIFIPLLIILLLIAPYIHWSSLFNLNSHNSEGLLTSISIVLSYFCLNFILSIINTVLLADQRPADASFRIFLQSLLSLLIVYILTITTKGSLINLCLAMCIAPLAIVLFFNFSLFRGRYRHICPGFNYVDFSISKDLLKLGGQFFIIQIAGLIQYQMINFLILRYYGPNDVTAYNISNRYFSVLNMGWSILVAPLWVAVTDAVTKKDFGWIRNIEKKYTIFWLLSLILATIMLFASSFVYDIWVGDKVSIPFILSTWILIYNIQLMFSYIYVSILNGSGILKVQMYSSLVSPLLFLALCYYFISNNLGTHYIVIAAILSNFNGIIFAPIQCYFQFRASSK